MCTNEYRKFIGTMQDAERIESAFGRRNRNLTYPMDTNPSKRLDEPVPMDIGNINEKNITEAEKYMSIKEATCFRCSEK